MKKIKPTLAGYFLPNDHALKGVNYLFVTGDNIPEKNAHELRDIYALAKKINPNEVAKSATNHFTVIVAPGKYTFGNVKFSINTQFIDIVSLTGNTDILIDGISVTTGNVNIKGIDTGTNAFAITSGLSNLAIKNCKGLDYVSDDTSDNFGTGDNFEEANY